MSSSVVDWKGLIYTDVWKTFIPVLFSKLVYSIERRELLANEVCEEESVLFTIFTNCVSSSLC